MEMQMRKVMTRLSNPLMKMILRSPLHGWVSNNVMLITVAGRKSGKLYTTTVFYQRQGDSLSIISMRSDTWWRNLRGGAPVTLSLQGRDVKAQGIVIEDEQSVAASLIPYLQQAPRSAKFVGLTPDSSGQFRREDVVKVAHSRVMVQVKLGESPNPSR